MSFTFMCMKAEFTIKHLGRQDIKIVQNFSRSSRPEGTSLIFLIRIQSVNVIHIYVYESRVHYNAFRST